MMIINEPSKFTFPKEEKLIGKKSIDRLFSQGKSFIAYPLRVVYCIDDEQEGESCSKILISVSKKKFKRAVKRNRVKRLVREAYRLNNHAFIEELSSCNKKIEIAFLFLKNELPTQAEIDKALNKALKELINTNMKDV